MKEIRNHFTHRNGELEVGDRGGEGRAFWWMMGAAVKLALLLGDLELVWEFDVRIQAYISGRSVEEVRGEFEEDGIEGMVRGLLGERTRQRVLAAWFNGDSERNREMRKRWVSVDLLVEGEEEWRDALSAYFRPAAATSPATSVMTYPVGSLMVESSVADQDEPSSWEMPNEAEGLKASSDNGGEAEETLVDEDEDVEEDCSTNHEDLDRASSDRSHGWGMRKSFRGWSTGLHTLFRRKTWKISDDEISKPTDDNETSGW